MKALILKESLSFAFGEASYPSEKEGHATVKIKRIGICGTDYHAFKGDQPFFSYPRVLGHELGGEVVSLKGNSEDVKIGDKVSIEPYLNCNECQACKSGHINACENIQVIGVHSDGGMTEYISIPFHKLHKSDTLSFDQLALVETLGIGSHATKRARVKSKEKVLIIGSGPIGLSVAQFCKIKGADICMADFTENRLDFAQKEGFSNHSLLVNGEISPDELKSIFQGELPDVIFDATGNKASMARTFNLAAHGGRIVLVGLFQGDLSFFDPNFHKRELSLLSSRNCLPEDFKEIIQYIEKGTIDTMPWISHRVAFDQLPQSFEDLLLPESRVIKAIVEMPLVGN